MKKLLPFLFCFLVSCNGGEGPIDKKADHSHGVPAIPHFNHKKYGVKSGLVIFETKMNTKSVNLTYKSIIYFDAFGMVERRDTYQNDRLEETFLSDGANNYNISHTSKSAVRTGHAYRGTESKFDWERIAKEQKENNKIEILPSMNIAGKKCNAYSVQTGAATATFAGWKGIILLNQIESAGGMSRTKAQTVKIVPINPVIFQVPKGYTIKG